MVRSAVFTFFWAFLGSKFLLTQTQECFDGTPMLDMLNAMEEMFGNDQFDVNFFNLLTSCMNDADPTLDESQNCAWQGMIDYWDSDGVASDHWGSYDTNYKEYNETVTSVNGMKIYEPCGYTSNVAVYHSVTELCARKKNYGLFVAEEYFVALMQGFSMMAMGSSFMHGAHTRLGWLLDNWSIGVTSYVMHQASLSSLNNPSSNLTDLSPEPREMSAVELARSITDMFIDLPVDEWYDYTDSLDLPEYYLTFSALVCTVLTISLEPSQVDEIITELAEVFHVDEEIIKFINESYLPELRMQTEGMELNGFEVTKFISNSVGTILKLIYAFLFQEQVLDISSEYFYCPFMNKLGWNTLPKFNVRMGQLQSYIYDSADFQLGNQIYPGDEFCNPIWPHPKWHLESAVGMLDLAYLSDEIHRLLSTYN